MSQISAPDERGYENSASLRLKIGPLAAPVLCRVISMMLARADCPLDRLDNAMLICDAISAHAPDHVIEGQLACTVLTSEEKVQLRLGEFSNQGAQRLIDDAVLPAVGNVLERMSDDLRVESNPQGTGEQLIITLNLDSSD